MQSGGPGADVDSIAERHVDVSVLVPVLNEEVHIREAVAAMLAQSFDGSVEFLYVDGHSQDSTRSILEQLAAADSRIKVLENPARNTPSALNIGLRAARGEFVVRMDAHTYYPPDYIRDGVERLRRGDVDWVCGPQVPRGEGTWSRRVTLALGSPLGTAGSVKWPSALDAASASDSSPAEQSEVELGPDSGVFGGVWRRTTLEQLGGWDEGWPLNQDSELLVRFSENGARTVQVSGMGAYYIPRNGLRALARQYWRYGQYREKTSRHHPTSLRPVHLMAPGLVVTAALGVLARGSAGRLGRFGLLAYLIVVLGASLKRGKGAPVRDLASLPLVFITMHGAWGAGYLFGFLRFGPPVAAIAGMIRNLGWPLSRP
jgi:succinoglycan biosynthesis protein ExoA